MNGTRFVGGDTMNYWINDFRDELLQTLKGWDFLLINDSEARLLSGESNLSAPPRKILDMGPNTLVIKRGEYGAMLFREDQYFIVPGYLLERCSIRQAPATVSPADSSERSRPADSI